MTTALLVEVVEVVGLVEMGETPFSVCEKSGAAANRTMARRNVFIKKINLCSFAATGRTGIYGQFGRKLAFRAGGSTNGFRANRAWLDLIRNLFLKKRLSVGKSSEQV